MHEKKQRLALAPALAASGWPVKRIARAIGIAQREVRREIAREVATRHIALPAGIQNEREFVRLLACDLAGVADTPALRRGIEEIAMFRVEPKRRKLNGSERIEVLERDRYRCVYCGVILQWAQRDDGNRNPRRATMDHVLPMDLGGENVIDNCVSACRRCNTLKRQMNILDRSRSDLHSAPSVTMEEHRIRSESAISGKPETIM